MKGTNRVIFAHLLLILAFLVVAGCGGGGNSASNNVISLNPQPTATETLQIANANLQLNGTSQVTASFVDLSGTPISGLPVTFTTSLGTLSPANGISTTDATGAAAVQLSAGGTAGTGILTASGTVAGVKITKVVTFSVAFPQVTLSTPVLGLSSLAPGGSTSVTVNLTDAAGQPFLTPVDVSFTSNFASTGKATLISPVRSVNGVASSTYTAAGGVGTDTITVSVGTTSVTAAVTVAGAAANSISFVSAAPKVITLKGMGGVGSETSLVIFKVLDTNGQPKAGQTVDFSLNTTVGGLALTSPSASSASDGTVSTIVQSGIVSTPIRVTATIHGSSPLIATQSDQLVVSTGIPAQDGMSLAVVTHNVEAYNVDGVSDVFTVFLADHFGNPVPDGTAVNFSAQVGQVTDHCLTANGRCAATWTSSGLRTLDGRAAILAYAIGEESFVDSNGNGVADAGTCGAGGLQTSVICGEFTDTTQAWRDDAHTNVYKPAGAVLANFPNGFLGDPIVDFNGTGKVDRDGIFNGILRSAAITGDRTKHVFRNNVIVMSTQTAKINDLVSNLTDPTAINAATVVGTTTTPTSTVLTGSVQDSNTLLNNPMSAGSLISIATQGTCLSVSPSSFTVPNTTAAPTGFSTIVTNSCATGTGSPGSVTVTVTSSPSGTITSKSFPFTW